MSSRVHITFCSSILMLSLAQFSHAQERVVDQVAEEKWLTFSQAIDELRLSKRIPGLSVSVVLDGKILGAEGYGYADNNREVTVTANTPFWVASLTKTFVGLAYLHLEADGLIDLDETAADTPNFTDLCKWLASTDIPFAEGLNCTAPISIRHILNHQVNSPPGTQFMYNPIMYSRLSRHLEHTLGEGVDRVEGRHNFLGQTIDHSILDLAGMTRTMSSMWDRSKMDVYFDMADGFAIDDDGNKTKLRRPDKHIAGGAGVVSTAMDLAKYEIALANGVVTPGAIKRRLESPATFNDGSTAPYGIGWYFQCYRGEKLMWHSGWDPDAGYSALHLRIPERNMAFMVLANSDGVWWNNPLDRAMVENSEFAQLFIHTFLPNNASREMDNTCAL